MAAGEAQAGGVGWGGVGGKSEAGRGGETGECRARAGAGVSDREPRVRGGVFGPPRWNGAGSLSVTWIRGSEC